MKHSLIAILFIAFAIPCSAQWISTGGNEGVYAFGVHDTSLFASGHNNLVRLNPTGEADSGLDFTEGNITTFASLGRFFFAGGSDPSASVCALSTNNGNSWKTILGGPVGTNGTYIFAQYGTRIARSTDSGQSWQHLPYNAGLGYAGTGAIVYANTAYNQILRSLDSGFTWDSIPSPFVGTLVTMGSVLFVYQNFLPGYLTASNGLVIESLDSGKDWDTVHVDSAGVPEYVTCLATDGKNLFAGGVDSRFIGGAHIPNGVYVSTDTGKTWRAENQGLGFGLVAAFGVYDTLLYATEGGNGPSYGTYYRPIHEMTDTTQSMVEQTAPPTDSIEIYPNPSTGLITILSGGSSVLGVSMLNVLGEDVLDISNSYSSTLSFDASRLASGTYFARIQTAAGTVLKKITLER